MIAFRFGRPNASTLCARSGGEGLLRPLLVSSVLVTVKSSPIGDGETVGFLLLVWRELWSRTRFFLFLFDKFRLNHLLKHANKKKSREDCSSVPVTCKTVVFRFF